MAPAGELAAAPGPRPLSCVPDACGRQRVRACTYACFAFEPPHGARVRTRVFVRPRSKCVPTQRLARSHTHRRARVLLPAGAEPRGTFQAAPSMQSGQTGAADAEVSPMHDSASFRRPKLPPLAPDSGDAPTRPAGRPDAPWQKSMPRMDVSLATGDDTLMCAGAGPAHSKRNGCADAGTNGSAPTPASCFLCQ